ncbi:MAG: ABC transporter substrate-binding protein [Atopococcus tabaci]|uniref:ABC transporter substrate-binding protein n=1 Tax=Atopococcus tabaci TaxID=269774 RepID=A0AA43UDE6_9LACT|nr:ABC transporter substrate-binding protein [Atopococcus tabaci]
MKLLATLFIALIMTACASGESTSEEETIEITDAQNHPVQAPLSPEKLAVFDYALLDNIEALGFSDRVAVTSSNPKPAYLEDSYSDTPTAGTLHEVDLETTMSEEPDMALIATRSAESYSALSEYLPTADFSLTQESPFLSIKYNVSQLAKILQAEDTASDLLRDLDDQRQILQDEAADSGQKALMVLYNQDDISVYGKGGRFGHIYDDFGFEAADPNIEDSNHGMQVSYEYLLEIDPDIIFVLDREAARSAGDEADSAFENHPLIENLSAKQSDEIHYLTPDAWYIGNGGLQAYQIMIDDISKALN